MHVGRKMVEGGRCAEPAVHHFTESITRWGITTARMKTGTPVRIDKRSVHFEDMEEQPGDSDFHQFSYMCDHRILKQLPCWTCYTNKKVHDILKSGLNDSPLYNGQIQSTGPRYCPSIETKLVTFPDKEQHPLFLEPEGEDTNEMYLNGFSSSMPMDIQLKALHEIPALRDAKIYRPGYAIEYDYFDLLCRTGERNHRLRGSWRSRHRCRNQRSPTLYWRQDFRNETRRKLHRRTHR